MVFNSTHSAMPENIVATEILQVETATVHLAADLNELLDKAKKRGEAWLKGEPEPSEAAPLDSPETVATKIAEQDTASAEETPKTHEEL